MYILFHLNPDTIFPFFVVLFVIDRFAYEQLDLYHDFGLLREEKITDALGMKSTAADRIWHADIFKNSTHRDGAIYKEDWTDFMDINDRNESKC